MQENELKGQVGKTFKFLGQDWTLDYDIMVGTYFFTRGADIVIYATPGYEGALLPIEISDSEGNVQCTDLDYDPVSFEDYVKKVEEFASNFITGDGRWIE